ncbi:MAG TPA: DMT family transporter [Trebonia sp.]|nr:DMT family transporter [Trebonia sp.]
MFKKSSRSAGGRRAFQGTGAVAALIVSGIAWGTSVPLSKVALGWLAPGWLTVARFGLAAIVLLVIAGRNGKLRGALALPVIVSGAIGYGCSVAIQNAGIARTSVTHASLIIGATPILVAIIVAVWQHAVARPVAWVGFALALGGVGLIAGGQGHRATHDGDLLVLVATVIAASVTVAQGRLLEGRDPIALTAVQFLGATLGALPFAATEGLPAVPHVLDPHSAAAPLIATIAVTITGTLVPFSLFAFGLKRVSAEVAGAFLNLEPLVGAVIGIVAFGDPYGARQVSGGLAIIGGIALSSLPLLGAQRRAASGGRVPARQPSARPALQESLTVP